MKSLRKEKSNPKQDGEGRKASWIEDGVSHLEGTSRKNSTFRIKLEEKYRIRREMNRERG